MTAPAPPRRAWLTAIAVVVISALIVALGLRAVTRFTATLPGAISATISDEQWSAAINRNFRSSGAADARNSLSICSTINGVYVGRLPAGNLRAISGPLNALRDGQSARFWLLTAKLTQLHHAGTPPDGWWERIEPEVSALAQRPPSHGLGALLKEVTENYAQLGLDPLSARQLATDQLSYTHGTTLAIACDLLARIETTPENTARLSSLQRTLLDAWVRQEGPIALRLLAAERLARLRAADDPDDARAAALVTWRKRVRGILASRHPTVLGLMARQPVPAVTLQTRWVHRYATLHWLQWTLYGAAPLALLGLVAVVRHGLAWMQVLAAGVAAALLVGVPTLLSEEWLLHSFRLGYPFGDEVHWPTFSGLAVCLGVLIPVVVGAVVSAGGRGLSGVLRSSVCVPALLGLLLWTQTVSAEGLRAAFLAAATAPEQDLAVLAPPPPPKSGQPSG